MYPSPRSLSLDSIKMKPPSVPSPCFVAAVVAVVSLVVLAVMQDEEENQRQAEQPMVLARTVLACRRQLEEQAGEQQPARKRMFINWNRARARSCVQEDYWGPTPRFNDRQFERVFRVTRRMADQILNTCAMADAFFTERIDACGKTAICPKVKILVALKLVAYGVSPSAFQDYFQMGLSTAHECLKRFSFVMARDEDNLLLFQRQMTRADAKKASDVHQYHHGVAGQIGSLDCMHVGWRLCPVAWQGQYQGSKGKPTIILEAFADHFLWIWHSSFSHPGSLNDINVWDRSDLLKSFLDGTFSADVDFEFEIGGETFHQVWLMVDGIYPELARFVKTIAEPLTEVAKLYATWQEASRKDIERAFGVLQRKFQILVRDVEQWYVDEIKNIVETCIILHNMMVAERVERSEDERADWYEYMQNEEETEALDPAWEYVERQDAEMALHRRLQDQFYNGPAVNIRDNNYQRQRQLFNL